MIYTTLTNQALKFCYEAHQNQVDKSGIPYVFHPFHLAEQMTDELSTVCALLHDVVEDTDYTFNNLHAMGYPDEVLEALRLLTHEKGVPYMDYIQRIASNPIAKAVKIADLMHNSDLTRLEYVDDRALARIAKYKKALGILTEHE